MHTHDSTQKGIRQGIISILVNTGLFALKFWAGIASGSLALVADAWHTLSDSLSSIVVIAGIRLSRKKPTEKHPFGYGRWEQISAMIVGFMLFLVAYEFFIDAIERLQNRAAAEFRTIAIIVTIISIVVKESLAQYAFWVYRKTGLLTMKADGWHHRSDAISSVVVLAGIFAGKYFGWAWWIDAVLGIAVALTLVGVCVEIFKSAIHKLLGEEVPDKLKNDIKSFIHEHFGNFYTHHYHIHFYGDHQELTFHLHVDGDETVENSHHLASQIEEKLEKQFHLECTIHIEPKMI